MVTDSGLNRRLRQHSRRAGLAVGLTMALTIAICIGGFSVLYAQLQPWISDFVSQEPPADEQLSFGVGRRDPTPTPRPTEESSDEGDAESTDEGNADDEAAADQAPPTAQPPTPTPEGFVPNAQSNSEASVNLRSEPSAEGGEETIITTLPAATALQTTGERAEAANPAEDGDFWVQVRTEDGEVGWIREIDTEPYEE
jgi:hypothetical protein